MRTPTLPADIRLRRDRTLVMALVLLVLGATAAYILAIVSSADGLRGRHALERNGNTARLCARLLDEECDNAISVLQAITRQSVFESWMRQRDRSSLRARLRGAVELVPDLQLVAAYDADGHLLDGYPAGPLAPGDASHEEWYRRASTTRDVFIGDVRSFTDASGKREVLTMAVPIGSSTDPTGFLLAYFQLGDIYDWLREVHVTGGNVLIVGPGGRVVAVSGVELPVGNVRDNPALRRARRGQFGAMLLPDPLGRPGDAVVGYAMARRPGWVLLVSQPSDSALAPSDYLLRRLPLITAPLLVLLATAAWNLVGLYHRQQRLAAELAERNAVLREQDRAKSDLLANVSHDLKTPIASMQLSVSGLLETESESWEREQVGECLGLVSQELDELSGRVRNLLDMSRLESGSAPVWREPCDMADIVATVLERLRLLLRENRVQARFPLDPLLVECDQTQMETVMINLLENAVKYSPPGSPIHLSGYVDGPYVFLRVRDQGPGVPDSERRRIFEKFYRSPNFSASGGAGLGLAICKTIMEAHGGSIHLETPPGGGAEFVLRLPRIREEIV